MCKIPAIFRYTTEMAACYAIGIGTVLSRSDAYSYRRYEQQAALFAGKRMIFYMREYDSYVPKSALKAYKTIAIEYIKASRKYAQAKKASEMILSNSYDVNMQIVEQFLCDAIAA